MIAQGSRIKRNRLYGQKKSISKNILLTCSPTCSAFTVRSARRRLSPRRHLSLRRRWRRRRPRRRRRRRTAGSCRSRSGCCRRRRQSCPARPAGRSDLRKKITTMTVTKTIQNLQWDLDFMSIIRIDAMLALTKFALLLQSVLKFMANLEIMANRT